MLARESAGSCILRRVKLLCTWDFADESARFALRFTCEDCAYHDPGRDHCAHEWPGGDPGGSHRSALWRTDATPPRHIVFCKEFELR